MAMRMGHSSNELKGGTQKLEIMEVVDSRGRTEIMRKVIKSRI